MVVEDTELFQQFTEAYRYWCSGSQTMPSPVSDTQDCVTNTELHYDCRLWALPVLMMKGKRKSI